jgi:transcriptional regulator with XRE-family HTH domain
MSIKQRRLDAGWSQEELARLSGLSTRTVQRIENGHTAALESLKCLAAVFNTSTSILSQEQAMQDAPQPAPDKQSKLNSLETEAMAYARSLLSGPDKGKQDALTHVERNAVDYAKSLLKNFGR